MDSHARTFYVVVIIGYLVAFYFLSLALRTIPVGIAYAILVRDRNRLDRSDRLVDLWTAIRYSGHC